MSLLKSILLLLNLGFVLSQEGQVLKPCNVDDKECLSESTQIFLEKTHKGIPAYNIIQIDPAIIPSLDFKVNDDLTLKFRNVNVFGLKDQRIYGFGMDIKLQSVVLSTEANLHVTGDILVEISKHKTYSGTYTAKAHTVGTAHYNYTLTQDDKGIEHYVVGPETIDCVILNEPEVTLNSYFAESIEKDPDSKQAWIPYVSQKSQIDKSVLCKMVQKAYVNVIHNIRAAAVAFPKNMFFNDV